MVLVSAATISRQWLGIGRKFNEDAAKVDVYGQSADRFQEKVAQEVDVLAWREPVDGVISGPMSPVLALQEVIEQLELRPVVAFAFGGCLSYPDGPERASYGLLGVEVRTTKQRFRLHLLDTGTGCIPMCLDWYEGES